MVHTLILADDLARPTELIIPAVALLVFGLLYVTPTIVALLRKVPEAARWPRSTSSWAGR